MTRQVSAVFTQIKTLQGFEGKKKTPTKYKIQFDSLNSSVPLNWHSISFRYKLFVLSTNLHKQHMYLNTKREF